MPTPNTVKAGERTQFLFERVDNVSENEFDQACEAAWNLVKIGRLRSYLLPILIQQSKNIATAAAHSISDFEAMKRGKEMLRRIEEEQDDDGKYIPTPKAEGKL